MTEHVLDRAQADFKVAVVGAGVMGANHVRVYREMPNVCLVGVADASIDAARRVASKYNCDAFDDYRRMFDVVHPQAVSIATPTSTHLDVAAEAISRGIHVLIEKPIALTVDDAYTIIELAASASVTLMIGHIERFNPAVIELKTHLAEGRLGRVFRMDARRQGPFPARVRDVGVVIDLAVHDLDIFRYVSGSEVTRLYAETSYLLHETCEDGVCSMMRLENGAIATLDINWLTPTKIRELTVCGARGMYRVDYLTQDLYFFENATASTPDWSPLQNLRGVSEGNMVRYALQKREPLRAELEAFVLAASTGGPVPVSGADGLHALMLAHSMLNSHAMQRVVQMTHPSPHNDDARSRQNTYRSLLDGVMPIVENRSS